MFIPVGLPVGQEYSFHGLAPTMGKYLNSVDEWMNARRWLVRCRVLKLLSEDPENYPDAPREGIRRILEEVTGQPHPRDRKLDTCRIAAIRMGTTVRGAVVPERLQEAPRPRGFPRFSPALLTTYYLILSRMALRPQFPDPPLLLPGRTEHKSDWRADSAAESTLAIHRMLR